MHTTGVPYEFPRAGKWYVKVSEKRNKNKTKERLDKEEAKEKIRGAIRPKKKQQCERCSRKYTHTKRKEGKDEETRRNVKYDRAFTDRRCSVPWDTETGIAEANHSDIC